MRLYAFTLLLSSLGKIYSLMNINISFFHTKKHLIPVWKEIKKTSSNFLQSNVFIFVFLYLALPEVNGTCPVCGITSLLACPYFAKRIPTAELKKNFTDMNILKMCPKLHNMELICNY
jgi:hypothetical protein